VHELLDFAVTDIQITVQYVVIDVVHLSQWLLIILDIRVTLQNKRDDQSHDNYLHVQESKNIL